MLVVQPKIMKHAWFSRSIEEITARETLYQVNTYLLLYGSAFGGREGTYVFGELKNPRPKGCDKKRFSRDA